MRDTIVALASATGGAISVIRVSGEKAFESVMRSVKENEKFEKAASRYAINVHMERNGRIIDETVVIKFVSPRSFTGEDVVEIYAHGGNNIAESIIDQLCQTGCRYARRGEFTRRAFENGKTDLSKAEAINAIIRGRGKKSVQSAMDSYLGAHRRKIHGWKEGIQRVQAIFESAIDFGEEDDIREGSGSLKETVIEEIREIRKNIEKNIKLWEHMVSREDGIEVALIGPPNAGKSSLMNTILGYERSIVYTQAGTTRDIVSENVVLKGNELRLIDTAGLCDSEEEVERIGIQRAWDYVKRSQIVLWVTSCEENFYPEEKNIFEKRDGRPLIAILNKTDTAMNIEKQKYFETKNISYIKTSALGGEGIAELREKLDEHIKKCESGEETTFIVSERQNQIMKGVTEKLEFIETDSGLGEEIAAQCCREAIGLFEEFEGHQASEELLNRIFEEFCIGK